MFDWNRHPAKGLEKVTRTFFRGDDMKNKIQCLSSLGAIKQRISPEYHLQRLPYTTKEQKRTERKQLTRLLEESPGKRDARNFLKLFDAPNIRLSIRSSDVYPAVKPSFAHLNLTPFGVNLGHLYQPTAFTRDPLPDEEYKTINQDEALHIVLLKLRMPQTLSDRILAGIALTLNQMVQLGLSIVVVLDCDGETVWPSTVSSSKCDQIQEEQAVRLERALKEYDELGALTIDHVLHVSDTTGHDTDLRTTSEKVRIQSKQLLYAPLHEGIIPIMQPVAYNTDMKKTRVSGDDVVLALVREFSGITARAGPTHSASSERYLPEVESDALPTVFLDRIVILDPCGGIPSPHRTEGAHVFVNLQAEYRDIKKELGNLSDQIMSVAEAWNETTTRSVSSRHQQNLEVIEQALRLLPPSASGLILTPSEAATKAIPDDVQSTPSKNPLLHNLLTDKPMTSSSLPTSPNQHYQPIATVNPPTFFKKGIPLTMIPDPHTHPWHPPSSIHPSIDLGTDPQINLPKLVVLINDSFRRKLDLREYLHRIRGRTAGVIIAGDYEGGAICTWETPSSLRNMPHAAHNAPNSPYWVPYLDKFAVLTSSQGSGGVSDIVWAALTRCCFPDGLVWRSRTSNPVNKWYQERSRGMWNLPGGKWTMFWTTEHVEKGWSVEQWGGRLGRSFEQQGEMTRWDAYIDVCSSIQPSWKVEN